MARSRERLPEFSRIFVGNAPRAARPFPVLLICDANDVALPCRHTQRIYDAARGPKQLWVVPGAFHTAALGYQPEEFRRRVLAFYDSVR
jgi:hypothetical protein